MIDLDALVIGPCMSAWGEQVTFMPLAAPAIVIGAVYTDRAVETKFENGDEITDTKTTLGCQASQFLNGIPVQNDSFLIRGRLWRVIEIIEDGHGHIRLHIGFANDQQEALPELPPVPFVS